MSHLFTKEHALIPEGLGGILSIHRNWFSVLKQPPSGGIAPTSVGDIQSMADLSGGYVLLLDPQKGGLFLFVNEGADELLEEDPNNGVVIPGKGGVWVRLYDGQPQVKWWGRDGAAINQCIEYCAKIGGAEYELEPITYWTDETILVRRACVGVGVRGKTVIKLVAGTNINLAETFKFDELFENSVGEVTVDPDLTLDCGFRRVVLHGNRLNQTLGSQLFGYRHYGRRPVLDECLISDIAGIGLLTVKRGTHTAYDFEDTNAPGLLGNLEILNCDAEHWVNDGLSDMHFGSIITNVCGDRGTLPRMSWYLPGERVNSVFLKGYGAQTAAIACAHMNLNGAVSGKLLVSEENSRLDIDTLICMGGEGCYEFRAGTSGQIKTLRAQGNIRKYGDVPEPYVENAASALVIGTVFIRRADADNAAHGIVDTGGGSYGDVIPLMGTGQAGSLFVAAGQNASIKRLRGNANNLNDCEGKPSAALVTKAGCQMLSVHCDFNGVGGTVWRNEQANTRVMGTFTGVLAAGGTFASGVVNGPGIEGNSLRALRVDYRDWTGAHKVSQARVTSASFDTLTTGAKTVVIQHNLWRAPTQQEIQATLRVGGFTTPPKISSYWLSSFDATSVTFRVNVEEAATTSGTVVAHLNAAIG